jgi:hypothetical protein
MRCAFVGSLAGAIFGFFVGWIGVAIVTGGEAGRDTAAIALFLGSFLAGAGAIAGAVVGSVADLREFFAKKDNTANRETSK